MKLSKGKLLGAWLHAHRTVLGYVAVLFALFFVVYALYGHPWGVAGYAALLGLAAGVGFAAFSFARFAAKHSALAPLPGRFPTEALPPPTTLLEADYTGVITALEAERLRLERENEQARRDAEEYYTLWAHQIKTPMAAMRLLLQSAGPTPTGQEKADIEQELFRIGQYVDMVLQYQRLSSLQNDLTLREFELEKLAKAAAKNCASLFIHKKVSLEISPLPARVITDEKWFCFVLEQLYTNAVKYTPSGGSVQVSLAGPATLTIRDTGVGIPPQDLPRVFERGFTGAVGRTERSSTGIGLYLCRQILSRLGFSISLTSTPGQGTCVLLGLAQAELEMD